jgi:serine/threonine-protein kinase
MSAARCHIFGAAALMGVLAIAPAVARAASAAPDAEAVAFFDEGRKLMAAGKYADAIARFEESLRHARTVGALLNLGRCYEETGRAASAWATYRAGESLAREMHDGREADAHRFAEAARPRVSTLTLDARALAGVEGVTVKRDGVDVGVAARGEAAPVDPGSHVVEVQAPGKTPWRGSIRG